MKGYKLNTDIEHVEKIIRNIEKKDGYCPCRIGQDESSLCPCDEFVSEGVCKCNLFIEISSE